MQTKIEGLIISKVPYDDRHIISSILLRSGKKISVVFYGGRGGGAKQKSSVIELGFMLSIELRVNNNQHSDVYHAKEWSLIWNHDKIRLNHLAFYQMCFFIELTSKISPVENLFDVHEENKEMVGLFSTLSNALVTMENSIVNDSFYTHSHSVIFLTKLLLHLGLYPERESCTLCGEELQKFSDMFLLSEEGGFACPPCMNQRLSYRPQSGRELWELMGHIAHSKYSDLTPLKIEFKSLPRMLFHYFCYQFHFEEKDFKSVSMVF